MQFKLLTSFTLLTSLLAAPATPAQNSSPKNSVNRRSLPVSPQLAKGGSIHRRCDGFGCGGPWDGCCGWGGCGGPWDGCCGWGGCGGPWDGCGWGGCGGPWDGCGWGGCGGCGGCFPFIAQNDFAVNENNLCVNDFNRNTQAAVFCDNVNDFNAHANNFNVCDNNLIVA